MFAIPAARADVPQPWVNPFTALGPVGACFRDHAVLCCVNCRSCDFTSLCSWDLRLGVMLSWCSAALCCLLRSTHPWVGELLMGHAMLYAPSETQGSWGMIVEGVPCASLKRVRDEVDVASAVVAAFLEPEKYPRHRHPCV